MFNLTKTYHINNNNECKIDLHKYISNIHKHPISKIDNREVLITINIFNKDTNKKEKCFLLFSQAEAINVINAVSPIGINKYDQLIKLDSQELAKKVIKALKKQKNTAQTEKEPILQKYLTSVKEKIIGGKRALRSTYSLVTKGEILEAGSMWLQTVLAVNTLILKKIRAFVFSSEEYQFSAKLAKAKIAQAAFHLMEQFNKTVFGNDLLPCCNVGKLEQLRNHEDLKIFGEFQIEILRQNSDLKFSLEVTPHFTSSKGCCMGAVFDLFSDDAAYEEIKNRIKMDYGEGGLPARAAAYQALYETLQPPSSDLLEKTLLELSKIPLIDKYINLPGLSAAYKAHLESMKEVMAHKIKISTLIFILSKFMAGNEPLREDEINKLIENKNFLLSALENKIDQNILKKLRENLTNLRSAQKEENPTTFEEAERDEIQNNLTEFKRSLIKKILMMNSEANNKFPTIVKLEKELMNIESNPQAAPSDALKQTFGELADDIVQSIKKVSFSTTEEVLFNWKGKKLENISNGNQPDYEILNRLNPDHPEAIKDGKYSIGIDSDELGKHAIGMIIEGDNCGVFDPNIGFIPCKRDELREQFKQVITWYPQIKNHHIIINKVVNCT